MTMVAWSNKENNVQSKLIEKKLSMVNNKQTSVQTKEYHTNQMIVDIKLSERGQKQ